MDRARLDMGLTKMDLARVARVGRSTIMELANRGKIPAREATRSRIEEALGWTPGSLGTVLAGSEPTLRSDLDRPLSGTTAVLVEQLSQIAHEARCGAAIADTLSKRLQAISETAESVAHLAARPN